MANRNTFIPYTNHNPNGFRFSKVTGWRGNAQEDVLTKKPDTVKDWPISQLHPQTPPPGTWEAAPGALLGRGQGWH